jgi:hypothetical protein
LGPVVAWLQEYVVKPLEELLALVPVGGEVRDLDRCQKLGTGIEGLFRSELVAQFAGWPPESTTDGSFVDLCIRTGRDSLEVVGRMGIDFSGAVFPFRAEIERAADGTVSVVGSIGQVDECTGRPPRLPAGTLIVPVRDENEQDPVPELIIGRRQLPIAWTTVLEWSEDR